MKSKVLIVFVLSAVSVSAQLFNSPNLSAHRIVMTGDRTSNPQQGVVAFSSYFGQGLGHELGPAAVQNTPEGTYAYYYAIGREHSPDVGNNSFDTAMTTDLLGMNATLAYANASGLNLSLLTLRFGPGGDPGTTWNLGLDRNGTEWSGNPASPIEYRIYSANPADVSSGLFYNDTQILSFGYSPFYMIINNGPTIDVGDDTIQAFSDPVIAATANGLVGVDAGLANALQTDIAANGGKMQLYFDSIQPATRSDLIGQPDYWYGVFSFDGSIQVVPEPSQYAAVFGLVALLSAAWLRRKNR